MVIPQPKEQFDVIDCVRGIAAVGVMLIHFSNSTLPTIKPNPLGEFFQWAYLGIPAFFIISGFIIPYAMHSAGYHLSMAGKFFLKRMIRMVPPAWMAILLMFLIYYGAVWLTGTTISGRYWPGTAPSTLLANLFFSFELFEVGKYIDLFWTLEVEFQYYILIVFLFPLIMRFASNPWVLTLILLLLNATYWLNDPANPRIMFCRDNVFFIIGLLMFLHKKKLVSTSYFEMSTALFIILGYCQHNMYALTSSIICVLLITHVRFHSKPLAFLGMVSYSLYITHHMSGVVAEFVLRNITGLAPSDPVKVVMLFVYGGISILFAWLFYKAVEEPALKWSKKVRLKPVKNNHGELPTPIT